MNKHTEHIYAASAAKSAKANEDGGSSLTSLMADSVPDKSAYSICLIKHGGLYLIVWPRGRPRGQTAAPFLSSGHATAITTAASQTDLCP